MPLLLLPIEFTSLLDEQNELENEDDVDDDDDDEEEDDEQVERAVPGLFMNVCCSELTRSSAIEHN